MDEIVDLDRDLEGLDTGSGNLSFESSISDEQIATSFDGSYTVVEGFGSISSSVRVAFAVDSAIDFMLQLPTDSSYSSLGGADSSAIITSLFSTSDSVSVFDVLNDASLGMAANDLDIPLTISRLGSGVTFDEDAQTLSGQLQPGEYEYSTEYFLVEEGFDAGDNVALAILRNLDFTLSFSEPDDDDLHGMNDDGDDGGVGGGPGGDGDPAVIPLPATAWGGLGMFVGAFAWRRLKK
ncbi:MAG: hypothetical protein AAGD32_07325 [Planctomycetota bacterium]